VDIPEVVDCTPVRNDEASPAEGAAVLNPAVLVADPSLAMGGVANEESLDCPPKAPKGLADGLDPAREPKGEDASLAIRPNPDEENALAEVCACEAAGTGGLLPARAPNGEVVDVLANPLAAAGIWRRC